MGFNLIEYFYPKEIILVDFDFGNDTFTNRFQKYIENDRGYFSDEFFSTEKTYLGKIDSTEFILRKKRKFMNPNLSPANANGKIFGDKDRTNIKIELNGNDEFNGFGKIFAHLFFLIIFITIIIKEAYPLLILFIPFSIAFLAFIHFMQVKKMKEFKENLMNILNQLRDE